MWGYVQMIGFENLGDYKQYKWVFDYIIKKAFDMFKVVEESKAEQYGGYGQDRNYGY